MFPVGEILLLQDPLACPWNSSILDCDQVVFHIIRYAKVCCKTFDGISAGFFDNFRFYACKLAYGVPSLAYNTPDNLREVAILLKVKTREFLMMM